MLIEESVQSAISSIRSNGIRSVLTALAIIIGTAAVIAVIGIGSSAEKALEARIDELGPRTLSIFPSQRKLLFTQKSSPSLLRDWHLVLGKLLQ